MTVQEYDNAKWKQAMMRIGVMLLVIPVLHFYYGVAFGDVDVVEPGEHGG